MLHYTYLYIYVYAPCTYAAYTSGWGRGIYNFRGGGPGARPPAGGCGGAEPPHKKKKKELGLDRHEKMQSGITARRINIDIEISVARHT